MREERPDLYDANVNGWIHGTVDAETGRPIDLDPRRVLLRAFHDVDAGGEGIARAILSDTYKPIDNLDALFAALDAIKEPDIAVNIVNANLSETRLSVVFDAPGILAAAPVLDEGYRSPFDHQGHDARWVALNARYGLEPGNRSPYVSAGFVLSNGETGGGAFILTPRFTKIVCLNGMVRSADAGRQIHLGGRLDDGIVRYSEETQRKALELVMATTGDAVRTFLDVDYLKAKVDEIEAKAGKKINEPVETIELISTKLKYTEAEQRGILNYFVAGGQMTAGGVLNAG